jgi:hypothetical protein
MDDLVARLSSGMQPAEIVLRPDRTARALEACIQRGYVHVKFPETRGGTELGVRLDRDQSRLESADYETPSGAITLVGTLTLNYVPVRCIAEIDVATLAGRGRLEPIES